MTVNSTTITTIDFDQYRNQPDILRHGEEKTVLKARHFYMGSVIPPDTYLALEAGVHNATEKARWVERSRMWRMIILALTTILLTVSLTLLAVPRFSDIYIAEAEREPIMASGMAGLGMSLALYFGYACLMWVRRPKELAGMSKWDKAICVTARVSHQESIHVDDSQIIYRPGSDGTFGDYYQGYLLVPEAYEKLSSLVNAKDKPEPSPLLQGKVIEQRWSSLLRSQRIVNLSVLVAVIWLALRTIDQLMLESFFSAVLIIFLIAMTSKNLLRGIGVMFTDKQSLPAPELLPFVAKGNVARINEVYVPDLRPYVVAAMIQTDADRFKELTDSGESAIGE